jgi:hypothetical protein
LLQSSLHVWQGSIAGWRTAASFQAAPHAAIRRRAVRDGVAFSALVVCALLLLQEVARGWQGDPFLFWSTPLQDMYRGWVPGADSYAYSPAWAQAFTAFTLLPWPTFRILWLLVGLSATLWLAEPVSRFWRPAFVAVCLTEVIAGNIVLLLAVAAVIAIRHPMAWAFVLLSKSSPGIALGWYIGRRDWRSLSIAVGTTVAIAVVSLVLVPEAWRSWMETLYANRDAAGVSVVNRVIPLWVRLAAGLGVAVYGGRTGRPWTIPVAMLLGMPHIWLQSFVVLAAIPRIRSADAMSPPLARAAHRPMTPRVPARGRTAMTQRG